MAGRTDGNTPGAVCCRVEPCVPERSVSCGEDAAVDARSPWRAVAPRPPVIPGGSVARAQSLSAASVRNKATSACPRGSSVIEVYERMREIATSSSNEGLILLNASEDDHTGQLSYPNFEGPLRNLHNPDVHALAAIAEAAGVDFRMLVLQRPVSWRASLQRQLQLRQPLSPKRRL